MKRPTITGNGSKSFNGLGDFVEAVAKVTGVKAAVNAYSNATGKDCGCNKRRDKLNKAIPFGRQSDDLQRDENPAQ